MRPSDRKVVGGFTPAVSPAALKAMRVTIRDLNIRRQRHRKLGDVALMLNPLLDRVLRTIYALSVVSSVPVRQREAIGLGTAQMRAELFVP